MYKMKWPSENEGHFFYTIKKHFEISLYTRSTLRHTKILFLREGYVPKSGGGWVFERIAVIVFFDHHAEGIVRIAHLSGTAVVGNHPDRTRSIRDIEIIFNTRAGMIALSQDPAIGIDIGICHLAGVVNLTEDDRQRPGYIDNIVGLGHTAVIGIFPDTVTHRIVLDILRFKRAICFISFDYLSFVD